MSYLNISIEFTREEFKQWCWDHQDLIENLKRPSLDRVDSNKNYTLENIQVIELVENIRKKRTGNKYINGRLSKTKRGIKKSGNNYIARITINRKEHYLGTFDNKDDAYNAFYIAYTKYYKKEPWSTGK